MAEQRGNTRYLTQAKVRIGGSGIEEIQLKDLSITGCRILYPGYTELELNEQYKIEIQPEGESKIGMFNLLVEAKWIKTIDLTNEIGFVVIKSPSGKLFQRYVDYLSWRYSHGNSMTGERPPEFPPV